MQKQSRWSQLLNRLSAYVPRKDSYFSSCSNDEQDIDPALDPFQKAAAFSPATRNLVIAGAGSGKSRILTLRVAVLLRKGVPLSKIRAITFTNAATKELIERLHRLTGYSERDLEKSVSTIHKFALGVLKKLSPETRFRIAKMDLINDPVRRVWDEAVEEQVRRNPDLLNLLAETIKNQNQEFNLYDFYLKQNHHPIPQVETLSGVMVRSNLERKVADFLYSRGIPFEYERPVLFAESVFRPDFYLPRIDAYVEVLGLWNHPELGDKYQKDFQFKRDQMEKWGYGYAYLSLLPEDMERNFTFKIDQFIKKLSGYSQRKLYKWEEKIRRIQRDSVSRAGRIFYGIDQSLIDNEMTIDAYAKSLWLPFSEILPHFIEIRFLATENLASENVLTDSYLFRYLADYLARVDENQEGIDYLFIDEFQDVQPIQMSFLEHFMSKNFYVIGDPRQSIYGFLGGSTYFIDRLQWHFKHVKKINLKFNYRSTGSIVELGNDFLRQFPRVSSVNGGGNKVAVLQLEKESDQVESAFERIKNEIGNEPIMILGRFDKSQAGTGEISFRYRQLCKKSDAEYHTFHRAKGREAENVMIVGCNFWEDKSIWECVPAKDLDHPLLACIQNSYRPRDKNEEERRLFYVALTRAKKRLFLVCQKAVASPFIEELRSVPHLVEFRELPVERQPETYRGNLG